MHVSFLKEPCTQHLVSNLLVQAGSWFLQRMICCGIFCVCGGSDGEGCTIKLCFYKYFKISSKYWMGQYNGLNTVSCTLCSFLIIFRTKKQLICVSGFYLNNHWNICYFLIILTVTVFSSFIWKKMFFRHEKNFFLFDVCCVWHDRLHSTLA